MTEGSRGRHVGQVEQGVVSRRGCVGLMQREGEQMEATAQAAAAPFVHWQHNTPLKRE
jgi:hypothetical protein